MLWQVISLVISSDMNITDCENPIRVYNKYLGEYVWTSCGHCNACKKKRASRWIARLETERSQHLVSFFVTLTYDNLHLPILCFGDEYMKDTLIDFRHSDVELNVNELFFLTAADRQYFDNRCAAFGGIPYANCSDIQKFHKRLNKYFHDKVSQKYANFRYFVVSEYGSTTFRPHFHAIYFVDEQSVADSFEEGVRSCWKNGHSDTQPVYRTASSYVANYINELFELPSFYKHRQIRPFFVCSKRPSIGCFAERPEDLQEIFDSGLSHRLVNDPKNPQSLIDVPLLKSVENRLYPKVKGFRFIPNSLRVALYRLALRQSEEGLPYLRTFEDFFYVVRNVSLRPLNHVVTMLAEYISNICHAFTDKGLECLKRLYYVSKRVIKNAFQFGITIEEYVKRIEDYWNVKELSCLNHFYDFQSKYLGSSEDLVYCYPEYCYGQNRENWRSLDVVGLPNLDDLPSYRGFVSDSAYGYDKMTKSHFKNSYFEKLKDSASPLFHLLNIYYAKKRYEIAETCGKSCT